MTDMTRRARRWPTMVALALAALAIGSVLGTARTGEASTQAVPANTAPPLISGTPAEGSVLTATTGTWTGSPPAITYTYQWYRCDQNGGSCASISGAITNTYTLTHADAGTTLRVQVTATNSDGSASSTSVPTAVVTAAPTTGGCPAGTGAIAIKDLSPPARLVIDKQSSTPQVITRSTGTLQLHYRVVACGGRPVQGALVYSSMVPFNQFATPRETATAADGTVNLASTQLRAFPAARQQRLLVNFIRARKPGEDLLGGVSTRLLISFPVSLTR
jgi:predicted actin-binding protein